MKKNFLLNMRQYRLGHGGSVNTGVVHESKTKARRTLLNDLNSTVWSTRNSTVYFGGFDSSIHEPSKIREESKSISQHRAAAAALYTKEPNVRNIIKNKMGVDIIRPRQLFQSTGVNFNRRDKSISTSRI